MGSFRKKVVSMLKTRNGHYRTKMFAEGTEALRLDIHVFNIERMSFFHFFKPFDKRFVRFACVVHSFYLTIVR